MGMTYLMILRIYIMKMLPTGSVALGEILQKLNKKLEQNEPIGLAKREGGSDQDDKESREVSEWQDDWISDI